MDTNKMPAVIYAYSKSCEYDPYGSMTGIWDTHEAVGDTTYVSADLVKEAMDVAEALLAALRAIGYPVSDAAHPALEYRGSVEARAMDAAARNAATALSKLKEAGL